MSAEDLKENNGQTVINPTEATAIWVNAVTTAFTHSDNRLNIAAAQLLQSETPPPPASKAEIKPQR